MSYLEMNKKNLISLGMFLTVSLLRSWHKLPTEAVAVLSLAPLQAMLDGVWSILA